MNQTSNQTVMGTLPNGDHGLILSYPTFIPDLDLNYVRASTILSIAGGVLVLCFLADRISRWFTLRRPLPSGVDKLGNQVPRRGKMGQLVGWPGVLVSKISLRTFGPPGVPSLGTILLILFWVGVNALASFIFLLPNFGLEGIAYRLP